MSEEKNLVEQLGEVIKELPASLQGPVVLARSEIVALQERVTSQAKTINQLNVERADAVKTSRELEGENEALRVRLHASELDVARLRGYQDRVHEFDPVPDREVYADNLPRRHEAIERSFAAMSARDRDAERPWFARRRA